MQSQRHLVLSERIASKWLRVHSALILFFLIAPILAIVPLSFNTGSYFLIPCKAFRCTGMRKRLAAATGNARSSTASALAPRPRCLPPASARSRRWA